MGRPEKKKPLRRSRRRQKDSIKIELEEVGREDINCNNLAQNRDSRPVLVNAVLKLRFRKMRVFLAG